MKEPNQRVALLSASTCFLHRHPFAAIAAFLRLLEYFKMQSAATAFASPRQQQSGLSVPHGAAQARPMLLTHG